MKGFFRHGRAIKHSVGSEDAVGETVGSECTCILYLHTVLEYKSKESFPCQRNHSLADILAYCTTQGQPRTPQGNDSLDLKKKKKKQVKERSISPNS